MARPNWEYIRVDVLLPQHPKLAGGSLALLGLLVTIWCYSGRYLTDGFIPEEQWRKFGTARQRAELVRRGFAGPVEGGYQVHDYLGHQRSRAEAQDLSAKRSEAGARGGRAKAEAMANALASAKQMLGGLPETADLAADALQPVDNRDLNQVLTQSARRPNRSRRSDSPSREPPKPDVTAGQAPLAAASKRSKTLADARVPAEAEAEAEQTHPVAEVVTTSVEGTAAPPRIAESEFELCPECKAVLDPDGSCFACRIPARSSK